MMAADDAAGPHADHPGPAARLRRRACGPRGPRLYGAGQSIWPPISGCIVNKKSDKQLCSRKGEYLQDSEEKATELGNEKGNRGRRGVGKEKESIQPFSAYTVTKENIHYNRDVLGSRLPSFSSNFEAVSSTPIKHTLMSPPVNRFLTVRIDEMRPSAVLQRASIR